MPFFPVFKETLVLPLPLKEVKEKLRKRLVADGDLPEEKKGKFNGKVFENTFRISLYINYPDNYLPLMVGELEATSKGTLVFITYRLFPFVFAF
ncbi:hypothetical protein [Persicobacter sp. CCB-QB2]|nr:hypothetical protein [Persicobacter sp. CCB-QB2]